VVLLQSLFELAVADQVQLRAAMELGADVLQSNLLSNALQQQTAPLTPEAAVRFAELIAQGGSPICLRRRWLLLMHGLVGVNV
jgi:hypothetical protein